MMSCDKLLILRHGSCITDKLNTIVRNPFCVWNRWFLQTLIFDYIVLQSSGFVSIRLRWMNNSWCLQNLVQLIRQSPSINWVIMHKLLNSLTFTFVFGVSFKTKDVLGLLIIEIKGRRLILPCEKTRRLRITFPTTCLHNHFENLLPLLLTRSVQNYRPTVFHRNKKDFLTVEIGIFTGLYDATLSWRT